MRISVWYRKAVETEPDKTAATCDAASWAPALPSDADRAPRNITMRDSSHQMTQRLQAI